MIISLKKILSNRSVCSILFVLYKWNFKRRLHPVTTPVFTYLIQVVRGVKPGSSAVVPSLVIKASNKLHRLQEDVLGVHEFGVVPWRVVVHVLLRQLDVRSDVGDLLVQTLFQGRHVSELSVVVVLNLTGRQP